MSNFNTRALPAGANNKSTQRKKNQNIQVVVRCRPLNSSEKKQGAINILEVVPEKKEILVRERGLPFGPAKSFIFDRVFGAQSKQIDIYKTVVLPLLNEVLEGYNCTLFAYGQTGTGKTFTMEGERSGDPCISWEEDPLAGVIPRAMTQLLALLHEKSFEYAIHVSYLEIYNEELTDLLGPETMDGSKLVIYEDSNKKGTCIINGLTEVTVNSKEDVYQILQQGGARRKTSATLMNAHSSRSHTLFMVTIRIKEGSLKEYVKIGKFNLVDLAGSECIARSGAQDRAAREAGNINQSLLTLGRVITALVELKSHVPYRESKLTRLLQDSLGGRTKTSIIATISPASTNLEETLSTLDYAFRARNITNKPEINQKLSEDALVKEYAEEIQRLQRELRATREKNGIYITEDGYNDLVNQLRDYKEKNSELTENYEEEKQNSAIINQKLSSVTSELEATRQDLATARKQLDELRYRQMESEYISTSNTQVHDQLNEQAEIILDVTNEVESESEKLHSKLDVLNKIDANNEPLKSSFKSRFKEWVSCFKAGMEAESSKQVTLMTSLKAFLDLSLEKSKDDTAKRLNLLLDDVKSDVAALSLAYSRHEHGISKITDEIENSTISEMEEKEKSLVSFRELLSSAISNKIQGLVDSALKGFADLKGCLDGQNAKMAAKVVEISSRIGTAIDEFVEAADKLAKSHEEEMERSICDINQKTEEQSDHYLSQIMSIFKEMKRTEKENREKMLQMMHNERKESNQHQKKAMERLRENVSEAEKNMKALQGEHKEEAEDTIQTARASVRQGDSVDDVTNSLNDFCSKSLEAQKVYSNHLISCVTVTRDQVREARMGFSEKTEGLQDLVQEYVEQITEERRERMAYMEALTSEQQAKIDEGLTTMAVWEGDCKNNFDSKANEVEDFFVQDLQQYQSSGCTPKRKLRDYPKVLPKRKKVEELKSEFRLMFESTTIEKEKPVPEDDEEVFSEASQLSTNSACQNEKKKNKENIVPPQSGSRRDIKPPRTASVSSLKKGQNFKMA